MQSSRHLVNKGLGSREIVISVICVSQSQFLGRVSTHTILSAAVRTQLGGHSASSIPVLASDIPSSSHQTVHAQDEFLMSVKMVLASSSEGDDCPQSVADLELVLGGSKLG